MYSRKSSPHSGGLMASRSPAMRRNSSIPSSEQVGNVSTWNLLQLRIPISAVVHVSGRDVSLARIEPEVEHSLCHPLGVPALAAMRNDPVEGEPSGIRRALDLGCLREALPPPAEVRLALDGVAEAAPPVGVDLSDSPSGRSEERR